MMTSLLKLPISRDFKGEMCIMDENDAEKRLNLCPYVWVEQNTVFGFRLHIIMWNYREVDIFIIWGLG